MNQLKTRLARVTGSILTALTLGVLAASPAAATPLAGQDVPETVTLGRGETGKVPWTYVNTGGASTLPASGIQVTFNAPGNTTFPAQDTVQSEYGTSGSAWGATNLALRNCTRSNANTTLTCDGYGINGQNSGWPTNGFRRFSPLVTVASNAPAETTLPRGSGRLSYTDAAAGVFLTADGTLNVATPPVKPMCLSSESRTSGSNIRIWECGADEDAANQRFVIDNGKIIRGDTYGTGQEMCVTDLGVKNLDLRPCADSGPMVHHQRWVVRDGQFVLKASINNPITYCIDVAGTRANDDNAQSMQCSDTPDQKFVVQGGLIKVEDTM